MDDCCREHLHGSCYKSDKTFAREEALPEGAGCKRFPAELRAERRTEYQRADCWNDNADINKEVLRLTASRAENHVVDGNSSSSREPADAPTKMVHVFQRGIRSIFR